MANGIEDNVFYYLGEKLIFSELSKNPKLEILPISTFVIIQNIRYIVISNELNLDRNILNINLKNTSLEKPKFDKLELINKN